MWFQGVWGGFGRGKGRNGRCGFDVKGVGIRVLFREDRR